MAQGEEILHAAVGTILVTLALSVFVESGLREREVRHSGSLVVQAGLVSLVTFLVAVARLRHTFDSLDQGLGVSAERLVICGKAGNALLEARN